MKRKITLKVVRPLAFMIISSLLIGLGLVYRPPASGKTVEEDRPLAEIITGEPKILSTTDLATALAYKNETVYVVLDSAGNVIDLRIVNRIYSSEGKETGMIIDYGSYRSVNNMTSDDEAILGENYVLWDRELLEEGDIYYEGILDPEKELPLEFVIAYYLNGEEIDASALAGKSGRLDIVIAIKNNLVVKGPVYYRNYHGDIVGRQDVNYVPLIVQGTYTADLNRFSGIDAPGAVKIVAGQSMSINFMAFPYPEEKITISMYGEKIELNNITFMIIPRMPPLPEIDKEDALISLLEGINALSDGLSKLYAGADRLLSAISQLEDGIKQMLSEMLDAVLFIATGLMELYHGADEILQGLIRFRDESRQMLKEVERIAAFLETFSIHWHDLQLNIDIINRERLEELLNQAQEILIALRALPDPGNISDGITSISAGSETLAAMGQNLNGEIKELTATNALVVAGARKLIAENEQGSELYALGKLLLVQEEQINEVSGSGNMLNTEIWRLQEGVLSLQANWEEGFLPEWQSLLERLTVMTENTGELLDYLEYLLTILAQLPRYIDRVNELLAAANEMFHKISMLPAALDELVAGQKQLRDGIKLIHDQGILELEKGLRQAADELSLDELQEGQKSIRDGNMEIHDQGILGLQRALIDAVNETRFGAAKIEKMRLLVDGYRSFADNENNRNSCVRFIVQTEKPEKRGKDSDIENKDNVEPAVVRPANLWERFLELFTIFTGIAPPGENFIPRRA